MMKNLFLTLATTFFLGINSLSASHAWGAEITYVHLSGNTYRFELVYYRDCAGSVPPNQRTLSITGCGNTGSVQLIQIGAPSELPGLCSGMSACATPAGNVSGVQRYVYQGTYTFPSQCADWTITFGECCLSNAITNLNSPSSYDLNVEAHLNNLTVQGNSSPYFNTLPLAYAIGGQSRSINFGAIDPDGDEIVYSLVPAAPLASNYTAEQPMCTIPANSASFDTLTGVFTITPCPNQQAFVAVTATEYRLINGVRTAIGAVTRKTQIIVLAGSPNSDPIIGAPTAISGNTGGTTGGVFQVCPGNTFSFNVSVTDMNVANTLSANLNSLPQGATATITGSNPVNIQFSWTPTPSDAGLHHIILNVFDNYCPVQGSANQVYTIIVQGIDLQANQLDFCRNTTAAITLNATVSQVSGGTYTWSAQPPIPNFNSTSSSSIAPASIRETTTFRVTYNDNICNSSDSVTVQAHGGVQATPSFAVFDPTISTSPIQATAIYPNPSPPLPDVSGLAGSTHPCVGVSVNRTIGTGLQNTSTTGGIGTPFQGFWHDGRFQMLFTASELQLAGVQAGRIKKLSLNVTQVNSTIPYSDFNIKLGVTTDSALNANNGFLSNTDLVYNNTTYTPSTGTNTFILQSPYFWNGADNLIVEICFNNSAFSNYDHVSFTPTTATSVLYRRIDASVGCALNAPSTSKNRPDIIFNTCAAAPPILVTNYAWASQTGSISNPTSANTALTPSGIQNALDRFIVTASDGTCTSSDTVLVLNTNGCGVAAAIHENSIISCINTLAELDAATYSFGTGALSYAWSTGENTPIIHTANTGIYTVTITAAGSPSCTSTATVNVTAHTNAPLAAITTSNDTITCARTAVLLTGQPIGTYTYNWGGLGTARQITINQSGIYTVTVTDATTGCTTSASTTIFENRVPPFATIVSNNGNTINCNTNTIILNACTPNSHYSYMWSDGGVNCGAHTCSQAGYYTVTVTDNGNGCTASMYFQIMQDYSVNNNQGIAIQASPSVLGCGHALLTVPSLAPNHAFIWNTGYAQDSLVATTYGIYTVTITSVQTGCSTTAIYNYTALSGTAVESTVSDCNSPTGIITTMMQGGFAPYQLSLDGAIIGYYSSPYCSIPNVGAGVHLVKMQSGEGCIVNAPITTHCAQAVLQGIVFEDINSNGLLDAPEFAKSNQLIAATQNGQTWYGLSNAAGGYSINVPTVGNYTLNPVNLSSLQVATNPSAIASTVLNDTTLTNIGIYTNPVPFNLDINLYHDNIRPGFAANYYLYFRNTGASAVQNAVIKLNITGFTPNSITCSYPHTLVNDTLIISVGNVSPNNYYDIITVQVEAPAAALLGQQVISTAIMEPFLGDANTANNTYTDYTNITGSFDPNDKKVNIAAYTFDRLSTGTIARPSPELNYAIRFQNTGSDTAFTVRIKDTLDALLDISTLKIIGASHPCNLQVDNQRVATFTFNNIRLVDSTHNEPASHGFVYFSIHPNDTLVQSGVPIRNRAAIYFDYNQPVLTNEVTTTPTLFVITVPEIDPKYSLELAPNPATSQVIITPNWATEASATLVVRDVLGRILSTQTVKNNQATTVSVADFPQGTYLTELWLQNKLVAIKKFVKM